MEQVFRNVGIGGTMLLYMWACLKMEASRKRCPMVWGCWGTLSIQAWDLVACLYLQMC